MEVSVKISPFDLKLLRLFKGWSNSFQVFENGRFEIGMFPKGTLSDLMIVRGWLRDQPLPAPGHYLMPAPKSTHHEVCSDPYFDKPFIISKNRDCKTLTDFEISKDDWKVIDKHNAESVRTHIIPVNESVSEYMDYFGQKHTYNDQTVSFDGDMNWLHILPYADNGISEAFFFRSKFISAIPSVNYYAKVLENHVMVLESEEFGFEIFLRLWQEEDKREVQDFRTYDADWLDGGLGPFFAKGIRR